MGGDKIDLLSQGRARGGKGSGFVLALGSRIIKPTTQE